MNHNTMRFLLIAGYKAAAGRVNVFDDSSINTTNLSSVDKQHSIAL